MQLEIISPEKTIYSGTVNLVQMPGIDGSFEILNNHAPIIAALKKGKVKIKNQNDIVEFIEIKGGVVEVLKNKIIILAD